MRDRAVWGAYALALLVLLLDQGSKALAQSLLDYARPVPVFSWFNLTLHYNEGAAFSFLSKAGGWQRWLFTVLALVVSLVLAAWIWRLPRQQWLLAIALALVLGGALGNVIDRVLLGHVVDFVSVHYAGYFFPTFNIADSAISVGAVLLLFDGFRGASDQ
ncbi:MAG: signal peptidase II [Chromatocurvus sp.]